MSSSDRHPAAFGIDQEHARPPVDGCRPAPARDRPAGRGHARACGRRGASRRRPASRATVTGAASKSGQSRAAVRIARRRRPAGSHRAFCWAALPNSATGRAPRTASRAAESAPSVRPICSMMSGQLEKAEPAPPCSFGDRHARVSPACATSRPELLVEARAAAFSTGAACRSWVPRRVRICLASSASSAIASPCVGRMLSGRKRPSWGAARPLYAYVVLEARGTRGSPEPNIPDQVALDLVGAAAEGEDQQAAVEGLEVARDDGLSGEPRFRYAARPSTSISSRKDSR